MRRVPRSGGRSSLTRVRVLPTVARRARRAVLAGRVALITGAASGQGRAAAFAVRASTAPRSRSPTSTTSAPPRPSRLVEADGWNGDHVARRRVAPHRLRRDGRGDRHRVRTARRALQQRGRADVGPARRLHRRRVGSHDRDEPQRDLLGVPRGVAAPARRPETDRSSTPRRRSGSSGPRATPRTAPQRPGSSRSPGRSRSSTGRPYAPTSSRPVRSTRRASAA